MKILVIGSGGREHALVWKLAQSPHITQMWCAPGNAGIQQERTEKTEKPVECVPIGAEDLPKLLAFAQEKKADLTVVAGTCTAPWSELVAARPQDIRLVLVGGVPLYGDTSLQPAAPATPGCEAMNVCGASKFVCVAEAGGTVSNKFGQTLADISGTLTQALADYDALNLTQWKFAPITPLVDCP